ncbi:MAG: DUF1501 domain-containing protein [Myxococcales bacterium]|nr:DUF1501 domain-containing protein [Myxococcales bacterium]
MKRALSRRHLLASLGLATGAIALGDVVMHPSLARADGEAILDAPLLLFVYFDGAWDTLLSLDPRDHTVFGTPDPNKAIYTGLDQVRVADPIVDQFLDQNPSGIDQPSGSKIGFGPAVGGLSAHYQDLCVVRGLDMGTLTHEVGRRYFLTGKFPRGVLPSGSALPTWIASQDPSLAAIPNLVVGGMETYNEGLDPKASGLGVQGYQDLGVILKPVNELLVNPQAMEDAIAAQQAVDHCLHRQLDVGGLVEAFRAGWDKALVVGGGTLWQHFDFVPNPPSGGEIDQIYDAFGINKQNPAPDLNGPKGRAAVAAQALVNDLCQVVSVRIQNGIDTHFNNWASTHSTRLRAGFDALASLITFLKDTLDPNGKPYWDRTTMVVFSEFARTPLLNAQSGRDHHLCNSCIVAGAGIAGNQVVGASTASGYEYTSFDFDAQTAKPVNDGSPALRPADVHATVCEAMGIGADHIQNQEPKLLHTMLA